MNKNLKELGCIQDSEWPDYYYLDNFPFDIIYNCEDHYELKVNGEYTIGSVTLPELKILITIFNDE